MKRKIEIPPAELETLVGSPASPEDVFLAGGPFKGMPDLMVVDASTSPSPVNLARGSGRHDVILDLVIPRPAVRIPEEAHEEAMRVMAPVRARIGAIEREALRKLRARAGKSNRKIGDNF